MSCGSSVPEPVGADDTRAPVVVVTGFLGSGKTTFINSILTGNHGKRIAVIENEFGEVGIDSGLVLSAKEEIFEMNNGCICCTVRGDLIRLLSRLLRRKTPFDAFLIETTGLADPAPVAQTFFVDDELKRSLRLDAILAVVDAKHISQQLDRPRDKMCVDEATEQIACADLVLLSKCDLVSDVERAAAEARVRSINGLARILPCLNGQVDLSALGSAVEAKAPSDASIGAPVAAPTAGAGSSSAPGLAAVAATSSSAPPPAGAATSSSAPPPAGAATSSSTPPPAASASPSAPPSLFNLRAFDISRMLTLDPKFLTVSDVPDHEHDQTVSSVGVRARGAVNERKFARFLEGLLDKHGDSLYRAKGILALPNSDQKLVFHGVHSNLRIAKSGGELGGSWAEGEERVSIAVFIGRLLDKRAIRRGFKACLAEGAEMLEPSEGEQGGAKESEEGLDVQIEEIEGERGEDGEKSSKKARGAEKNTTSRKGACKSSSPRSTKGSSLSRPSSPRLSTGPAVSKPSSPRSAKGSSLSRPSSPRRANHSALSCPSSPSSTLASPALGSLSLSAPLTPPGLSAPPSPPASVSPIGSADEGDADCKREAAEDSCPVEGMRQCGGVKKLRKTRKGSPRRSKAAELRVGDGVAIPPAA